MSHTTSFDALIEGKKVHFDLSKKATKWLENNDTPIFVGLELYFSCFIKKMVVQLKKMPEREVFEIYKNLFVYFRPVQSKSCNIHDLVGTNSPTLIDLPVIKRKAIIPGFVNLNVVKGVWTGDFTWRKN